MATREKIMVAAMILAVAFGAYTLLAPSGNDSAMDSGLDREALTQQITAATSAAQANRPTQGGEAIIQLALRPWLNNPFFRPPPVTRTTQEEAAPTVPDPLPEFTYQGYLETDAHQLAMINGRTYAAGEKMQQPGFEVLTVNPESVVIGFRAASGEVSWRQEYTLQGGFP